MSQIIHPCFLSRSNTQLKYYRKHMKTYGFTLIELLTVIAIIGVLAAILIPAVLSMRTKSWHVQSANNLRQVYAASQLYALDHDMYLPNSWVAAIEGEDNNRAQSSWKKLLYEGGYVGENPSGVNHLEVLGSPVQRNLCPSQTINHTPPRLVTFGMNNVTMLSAEENYGVKTHDFISPARTILFSEGHLNPGEDWFSAGISNYRLPNNVDNVVNFIYADGHIGMLPIEEFPKVIGAPYSDSWYFWKGLLD